MAKVIIECITNGEAFELVNNLLYAANEAKFHSFKDYINSLDRGELENADICASEYKKFKELSRQIASRARVEL